MATDKLIDLHVHSTASDGTDTPAELVKMAKARGIAAMALTDHDTAGGLAEAEQAAMEQGIEFIPGCELSTVTAEGRFHVVGLWMPRHLPAVHAWFHAQLEERDIRNRKIVAILQNHGIPITWEEIGTVARGTPGRPHIASLLIQKGIVKDKDEAFQKWLGTDGLAYVEKRVPSTEQAVEFLAGIGAVPVLAHPMLKLKSPQILRGLLQRLKEHGLAAVEAWHSSHTSDEIAQIISLANSLDLAISGGSDFHGKSKPAFNLGTGKNNLHLTPAFLDILKRRCKRI